MECLAYLHIALAYEADENSDSNSTSLSFELVEGINWKQFSSQGCIHLLSLALTVSVLNLVSNASALQRGARAYQVRNIQSRVIAAKYFNARATGISKSAVRRFQIANGLKADGIVGSNTLKLLNRYRSNSRSRSIYRRRSSVYRGASNSARQGDRNSQVVALQMKLRAKGLYDGPIDGIFGPRTEAGLRQFQQFASLPSDGVARTKTLRALGESTPRRVGVLRPFYYPNGSKRMIPANGLTRLVRFRATTPYVVVVPLGNYKTLTQVRQYVRNAYFNKSRLGPYVYAGSFISRSNAESRSEMLRSHRLDARVVYRQ